ncbi:MAG TPA: MFS transporter [Candidatus Baltobacteraceae bacterium]
MVLSNTTLGTLIVTINTSILLISLPSIFRGLGIDPLAGGQSTFLLWILMGYMLVTAVLLVTCGRISDLYGRVRMYNLGFVVFTVFSLALALVPSVGIAGAMEILILRLFQGVGGAFLLANSAALITDAFPAHRRGMAMGINQIAAIAGSLLGLLVGGVLSSLNWRLVFLVSVPIGIFGSIWAYLKLHQEARQRESVSLDIPGNVTFALGLTLILVGITYGIQPYGKSVMGWGNPFVIGAIVIGLALLGWFVAIERRAREPLFRLDLFAVRAFAAGNIAGFTSSLARGGLQFILIIWLQGIWLPLHGYTYADTPLWAGIYVAPMIVGFVITGPLSGALSDRFGARAFSTIAMILSAGGFVLLSLLPGNFAPLPFFAILAFLGCAMGLFAAPNTTSIMNAAPAKMRGVASGMRATFQNAATMASIALFFTLLTLGLAQNLPAVMRAGLISNGVPATTAASIAGLPPITALFAAFLGYNPMRTLIPAGLAAHLSAHETQTLFGTSFFPHLILPAFMDGMHLALWISAILSLVAAVASALRGKRYIAEKTS